MSSADTPGSGQPVSVAPGATPPPTLSGSDSDYSKILGRLDHVGPGWHPILVALHQDLTSLDPDYAVFQVKEKFGGLRVYLDSGTTPEIEAAIDAAEALCAQTCESCGAPGRIRETRRSWLSSVCDECHVARQQIQGS